MNTPVQAVPPVNATVTIQPVVAALSNNSAGGAQNPLSNVPVGTTVEGFVINRDVQNNPIVRTAIGDLKVTSEVFLKTGSEVVFRVDATQSSMARIITVDGMTPDAYHAQNTSRVITSDTITTTALQSPLATAETLAPLGKPLLPAGPPTLQAIILQPNPNALAQPLGNQTIAQAPLQQSTNNAALQTPLTHAMAATLTPMATQLAGLRSGAPLRLTLLDLKLPPLPVTLAALPQSKKIDSLVAAKAAPVSQQKTIISDSPVQTAATSPTTSRATPLPPAPTAPIAAPAGVLKQTPAAALAPTATPTVYDELAPLQFALQQHEQVRAASALAKASHLFQASELITNYGKQQQPSAGAPKAEPVLQPQTAVANAPLTNKSSSPTIVTASVIGHDAEGANILHTSFASLKLYTSQPLPTGTTLVVQAHVEEIPHSTSPTSGEKVSDEAIDTRLPLSPLTPRPSEDAIDEALNWLTTNHPDLARDVANRLPTPDNKLASGLLFFIAAMKGGDVAALFGARATRQLELQAPALFTRLRQQLAATSDANPLATAQPWMTMLIPMLHGQELQQLRLYVQREPEQEKSAKSGGAGQRFVLEVNLTALGPMQLDGFIRQHERNKHFDLMIRTALPLDPQLSQEIRSIFEQSLQATRLVGQVLFQTGQQHFFKPEVQNSSATGDDSMQTILA